MKQKGREAKLFRFINLFCEMFRLFRVGYC